MPPKKKLSTIPEDEEPKTVKLNEESKLSSKFIVFDCPVCHCKLQLRNEIEINPKGIKCKCNPCSFKISKNDKTMSVVKNDDGDITLESEDHCILTNTEERGEAYGAHAFSAERGSSSAK